MSQDNMPALPEAEMCFKRFDLFFAEQMHAYAREYAEMRVKEEWEACWQTLDRMISRGDIGGNGWDPTAERNGLILAANAIRARSGAQDEGRTG